MTALVVGASSGLGRALAGRESRRRVAQLLRLVADALQVGDRLDHGDDQAQVGRGRAARRQDAAAVLVDRDFHRIDARVEPRDLLAEA